jgi:hypothetical protein
MRPLLTSLLTAALLAAALPVHADWTLDNSGSQLSFVSIKATDVAEVHTFTELSGSVGADGHARVVIQLASVDTLIPIRDERMREVLFKTDLFPTATADARLNLRHLQGLGPATSEAITTEILFSIGEVELPITTELLVSRLAGDRMLVATLKPIIVDAAAVSLADGVEQLREIAGLPSISKAVPVSFVLQFTAN